jgi:flagellar hook-associated protein 2
MPGTASVGGLISGLDTNSILDQLYQAAQAPIKRLEDRKSQLSAQSTAWSQLEGKLLAFRTLASQLARPITFQARSASTSRPDLVAATASAAAVPGSYTFTVLQLAQTQQMASGGYPDTSETEFASGTISIAVGDGDPLVIQTEGLTLAELRDAINAAQAGAVAAIINDGSGATPYRLVLTSSTSGLAGAMTVVTTGAAPAMSDLQAAQDAQLQLGAGAVVISGSSNTISDAVPGVTLSLVAADPTAALTLTIARDAASAQSMIADFVDAYNDIVSFFSQQFAYDPDTGQTGTLFSDYQLQSIQRDLTAAVTNPVFGLAGAGAPALQSLAQLGLRTDASGQLSRDSSALAAALSTNPDGVARVFAAFGETTSTAVTYLSSGADTQPSGSAGWQVEITQAARRAQVTAGVAQTDTLLYDETLTVQGVLIALTAGMTPEQVVAAVNEHQQQTGVVASRVGGLLTLTRAAYGSAFHIEVVSSRSNQGAEGNRTSGFGNVTVTDQQPQGEAGTGAGQTGLDVQGTIGGEAATGSGQRLTGSAGAPMGLTILVTAGEPGSYGKVTFTVGAAEAAARVAGSVTDSIGGTIAASQHQISDLITDINQEIARLQALIDQEQERLRTSFQRMEVALGQFETQSQFLASQFAQMQRNAAASSR